MDTDAPAASVPAPTAQHGVDEVPQDWKLVVADKVRQRRERRQEVQAPPPPPPADARSPPLRRVAPLTLPCLPTPQRFAYRLASDSAAKAALQADIVAAYMEHGERGRERER